MRNTPAYAGKTATAVKAAATVQKHPRVCGEDVYQDKSDSRRVETPPRMRGRLFRGLRRLQDYGNTPAYAGKTYQECGRNGQAQKHPRVCGEDPPAGLSPMRRRETPPRMRGRPICRQLCRIQGRNTPAYAGKTTSRIIWLINTRKHPRVCGEDHLRTKTCGGIKETPPRMRGRRYSVMIIPRSSGNTPAYAGKTLHT